MSRTDLLTTTELYHLDQACLLISKAFGGEHPYLVGSAGLENDGDGYRDVDVRLMLDDSAFAAACPTRERWELLCLAIGSYLSERSGLPVDFQIQSARVANERFSGPRNPLGMTGEATRIFAGGGDGTPEWGVRMKVQVLTLDEVDERNVRFHAIDPRISRDDFERTELAARGTGLFCWQPGYGEHGGFSWLCPGCARWHFGVIGEQPVSGWDDPRWVSSGTPEAPTLTPSLGCPGWKHGTCPEGHYWLRDGELIPA